MHRLMHQVTHRLVHPVMYTLTLIHSYPLLYPPLHTLTYISYPNLSHASSLTLFRTTLHPIYLYYAPSNSTSLIFSLELFFRNYPRDAFLPSTNATTTTATITTGNYRTHHYNHHKLS